MNTLQDYFPVQMTNEESKFFRLYAIISKDRCKDTRFQSFISVKSKAPWQGGLK